MASIHRTSAAATLSVLYFLLASIGSADQIGRVSGTLDSTAYQQKTCTHPATVDEKIRGEAVEAQRKWDRSLFTTPSAQETSSFRFLVHASYKPDFYSQLVPQKSLSDIQVASISILDQNHTNTFGNVGVILSVPPANIFATNSEDMFSYELKDEKGKAVARDDNSTRLRLAYQKFGIRTPDQILLNTKSEPSSHYADQNEILVTGCTKQGGDLKIIGIFVKTDSLGNILVSKDLLGPAMQSAEIANLKIVKIGPPNNYPTVKITEVSKTQSGDGITTRTIKVMATKEQFLELEKKAEQAGHRLLAIQENDSYYSGAFRGLDYVEGARPDTLPSKMSSTHPFTKTIVTFIDQ
jgi:hypothetical protein